MAYGVTRNRAIVERRSLFFDNKFGVSLISMPELSLWSAVRDQYTKSMDTTPNAGDAAFIVGKKKSFISKLAY
jgi:hypothetical protein